MIPQYMLRQQTQHQEIIDKELNSHMSDFLDELEGVQKGPNQLLNIYQLFGRPLIRMKYSGRTLKRTTDSLKTSKQLLQLENNS